MAQQQQQQQQQCRARSTFLDFCQVFFCFLFFKLIANKLDTFSGIRENGRMIKSINLFSSLPSPDGEGATAMPKLKTL